MLHAHGVTLRITNSILFTALIAISSRSYGENPTPSSFALADRLAKMTVEQKVGQLLMIGFSGTSFTPQNRDLIQYIKPGSIIIFGQNIKSALQISQLNFKLQLEAQRISKVPALIAVDQEGGPVVRIRTQHPLPSARAVGQTGDSRLAHEAGLRTGELMRTLGFNMNLAPVLDIGEQRTHNFIGVRAFSSDPNTVKVMGEAFANGLQEAQVLPTAKHFPGHGGGDDSHFQTVVKNDSLDFLLQRDLVPFGSFARSPFTAIMMAHVNYTGIDEDPIPATFSPKIITHLLREQLNYDGLVLSDDIEMTGAKINESVGKRAQRAILAGVDIVMVAWNRSSQIQAYEGLLSGVKSGIISMERLDASVTRILRIKEKFAHSITPIPSIQKLARALKNKELSDVNDQVVWRNFQREKPKLVSALTARKGINKNKLTEIKFVSSHSLMFDTKSLNRKNFHVSFDSPRSLSGQGLTNWLAADPHRLVAVIVSGKKTEALARSIHEKQRGRVILIHAEKASAFQQSHSSFFSILDIWSYHPQLASWLMKVLTTASDPVVARH